MHLLCSNIYVCICCYVFFAASDSYPILKFHYLSAKNICMFILCFANSLAHGKSLVESH